ncbi:hypothetical protein ABFA25_14395 [Mycobacterium lepromatosis]|uniref:hypothetical protein n=1 Tax=Mycobacterium lepromatosis TaxID=480418 RepID=UPI003D805F96
MRSPTRGGSCGYGSLCWVLHRFDANCAGAQAESGYLARRAKLCSEQRAQRLKRPASWPRWAVAYGGGSVAGQKVKKYSPEHIAGVLANDLS